MQRKDRRLEHIQHNLQLNEQLDLHQKGWVVQTIGWGLLYGALILALLGLFGTGWLSYQKITGPGSEVKYERFLRYESETEMVFNLDQAKDTIILSIPQSYIAYIDVVAIEPLPGKSVIADGQVNYYFPALGRAGIHCTLMAKKTGNVTETVTLNGQPFQLSHLIYP